MKSKVAIVGMGNVGATIAYNIVINSGCDTLIITDSNKKLANAQMLDLRHAAAVSKSTVKVNIGNYNDFNDVDIVIFTAATPLVLGQTRLDMLESSKNIVDRVIPHIMESGFNGIFVIVTNPVDIISFYVYKISGLPASNIIGTGTALDTARLKMVLSSLLDVNVSDITAYIIGEHGDSQVIVWSQICVKNMPLEEYCIRNNINKFDKEKVAELVKNVGWDIANVKHTTNFGIASVVKDILDSILNNEKKLMLVSNLIENDRKEYFTSCPVLIGRSGIERKIVFSLSSEESMQLKKSSVLLKKITSKMNI